MTVGIAACTRAASALPILGRSELTMPGRGCAELLLFHSRRALISSSFPPCSYAETHEAKPALEGDLRPQIQLVTCDAY